MTPIQNKNIEKPSSYLVYSVIEGVIWTLLLGWFCYWSIKNIDVHTQKLMTHEARAFFQEIVTTRSWNAAHGGVYVPVTEKTQPNPYLDVPNRDVVTVDGLALTKINPAYMTRQIAEIAANKDLIQFHITSANPIRPANAPDPWESEALKLFAKGIAEYAEFIDSDDAPTLLLVPPETEKQEGAPGPQDAVSGGTLFRYMAPLWVSPECLKCHAKQGYKKGDLRGGISVTLQTDAIINSKTWQTQKIIFTYFVIWILGLMGIQFAFRSLRKEELKREKVILELQDALAEVKTLGGLIPICSQCKKIRDDKGYWNQIEEYIETRSEASFSHSICHECEEELYGDEEWYKKARHKQKK